MTDLNLLYGSDDNLMGDQMERKENGGLYSSQISGQQLHKMASQNDMAQDDKNQQMQQMQQVQQQQMQQQMKQQIQQQVQAMQVANPIQQSVQKKEAVNYQRRNDYGFMDRMNMKRGEVIKLALFSLVIVLGISIDRMLTYYLSRYVEDNVLTDFQELLLRLSYPIAIFLLLWIFKAI